MGTGPRRGRLVAAAALGLAAVLGVVAVSWAGAPQGSVRQVSGKDGCYTADGSGAGNAGVCHNIRGGTGSTSLAIAPGGKFAYLDGYGNGGSVVPVLSAFRRDRGDGTLHQLKGRKGCFSRNGSSEAGPGTCTNARNLDSGDATSLTISRDGRFLYVASQYEEADAIGGVAIFRRNLRDGTLHQLKGKAGCVSATGESEDGPGTCAKAHEAGDISNVHITPDQKFLYAANYDGQPHSGIAIFRRNARNGKLHQLKGKNGCITDDGTTEQSGVNVVCRKGPNLGAPWDTATPDNRFVYASNSYDAVVQGFKRNSRGGLVEMPGKRGCVSEDGTSPGGACVNGRGLEDVERAVLSKNERFIYTNAYSEPSAIAVLNRSRKTGKLSQRHGKAACFSADGTSNGTPGLCRDGRALGGGYAGALSPNGRTLYFSEYSADGFTVFRVSPKGGGFSQLSGKRGCVTSDGSSEEGAHTCQKARAVAGAYQVALAAGGHDVYVSSYSENGVSLFHAAR